MMGRKSPRLPRVLPNSRHSGRWENPELKYHLQRSTSNGGTERQTAISAHLWPIYRSMSKKMLAKIIMIVTLLLLIHIPCVSFA